MPDDAGATSPLVHAPDEELSGPWGRPGGGHESHGGGVQPPLALWPLVLGPPCCVGGGASVGS
eukprot:6529759-Prorocentrum_lima.AAC.1